MGDREEGGKDGGGRWRHELVLDTGDDRDPLKISSVCVCVCIFTYCFVYLKCSP